MAPGAQFSIFTLLLITWYSVTNGDINNRWCPIKCHCMNDYETVDCSHRSLNSLPEVSNLTKRLYAQSNSVSDLDTLIPLNLTKLSVLEMPKNNLTEITSHTLCSLPRLMEINLASNHIVSVRIGSQTGGIDDQLECQLHNLQTLHLEYNRLYAIPKNLSSLAPHLHILNLAYNEIHAATLDSSFTKFTQLEVLDLSGNPIHVVRSRDLDPLGPTGLATLSFHDCSMSHLSDEAFRNLTNLTSLTLSRNNLMISELEAAFVKMAGGNEHNQLAMLDIKEGPFTTINSSNLAMFPNLVILDISYSSISYVDPGVFEYLPKLEVLNLEANFLTELSGLQHPIGGTRNLRKLLLRDNKINEINLTGLSGQTDVIDLSGNQLRTLPADWLESLEHINILNVSDNTIRDISHRAFKHASINTLDLSHNQLTTLARFGEYKVQSLDMSHNNVTIVTDDAFDNMEPYLEELDLSYNALREFVVLVPRDFRALQRLNLAHNQLVDSAREGRLRTLFRSLSHLQVLDLSFNQISGFPSSQTKQLHHLTTLQLEGNRVEHLEQLGVHQLPSLAKLLLAHNRLQLINVAVLANMTYLERVDFSRNPFLCSCQLQPFQLWLNETFVHVVHIEDREFYTCASPEPFRDQYIVSVNPDMAPCKTSQHTISRISYILKLVSAALLCICVISIAVCLICYYTRLCSNIRTLRYKWQVRYREVNAGMADCAVDTLGECDEEDTTGSSYEQIEVADNAVLTLKNDHAEDVEIFVK